MPRTAIPLTNPVFKVADTEAGLTAGDAYECQITSAVITSTANFQTIPATGCEGASQSPGLSSWALDLTWLQDWSVPGGGLSEYAFTNDTLPAWFSLSLDSIGAPTLVATGQAYVTAGAYGGTFGDGSAPTATATWPCLAKPAIVTPVVGTTATASSTTDDDDTAVAA